MTVKGTPKSPEEALNKIAAGLSIFDDQVKQTCVDRGLIPLAAINHIEMALFLTKVSIAARVAQKLTGIPSSFLIAKAAHDSGWGCAKDNSYFNELCDRSFATVESCFICEAELIAHDPKFKAAMELIGDSVDFTEAACECGLGNDLCRKDLVDTILRYELQDCDHNPDQPSERRPRRHHLFGNQTVYDPWGLMDMPHLQ